MHTTVGKIKELTVLSGTLLFAAAAEKWVPVWWCVVFIYREDLSAVSGNHSDGLMLGVVMRDVAVIACLVMLKT